MMMKIQSFAKAINLVAMSLLLWSPNVHGLRRCSDSQPCGLTGFGRVMSSAKHGQCKEHCIPFPSLVFWLDCLACADRPYTRALAGGRNLVEEAPSSKELLAGFVAEHDGTLHASFHHEDNVLSKEKCESLTTFIEDAFEQELLNGTQDPHFDCFKSISMVDLAGIIGNDAVQGLLKIFLEVFGRDTPVSRVLLRRQSEGDFNVDYHKDLKKQKMLVNLNDGYSGAELICVNGRGTHVAPTAVPGSAFLHGSNIVHGVTAHKGGPRYTLFLDHIYDRSRPNLLEEL